MLRFRSGSVHLPAVSAAVIAAALAGSSRAQDTLRLTVEPAPPGASSRLRLRGPYANRDARAFALSPTGAPFEVGAPVRTDEAGTAQFELRLNDEPSLAGLNGIFFASVAEIASRTVSTARVGARFPAAAEASSAEPVWVPDEAALAPLAFAAAAFLDIDSDGNPDLAGVDAAGVVSILINDGAGSFTDETATRFTAAGVTGIRTIIPADLNGDGHRDLFACTQPTSDDNWILLASGAAFTSAVPLSKGGSAVRTNDAVIADLDADGDVDIFVANGISGAHGTPAEPQPNTLYLNDGAGSFSASEAFGALGVEPAVSRSVDAGDADGDGDLDLVIGTSTANQLLLNDGAAAFTFASERLPEAADSTYGAAFTDVDLDGDLDIVLGNTMFDPLAQVLLINQGHAQGGEEGQFAAADFPPLASGQSPIRLGLEVIDVDADGDPDLIFPTHELGNNETPDLYLNQGGAQQGAAGTFVKASSFPVAVGVYSQVPAADVDGDGDLDVLVLGAEARVLRSQVFSGFNPPLAFRRGDVNEDGAHDLSDAIALLGHLFLGAPAPRCELAADVNDSNAVDLSDAVSLLGHLFLGTAPPAAPFLAFGDPLAAPILSCARVSVFE